MEPHRREPLDPKPLFNQLAAFPGWRRLWLMCVIVTVLTVIVLGVFAFALMNTAL
jgi:hypothetical protein